MSVNSKMTAIADNIRDKTGSTDLLTLDDMAEGVNEVYEAGRKDMVEDIEAPRKTVSGEVISVNDVSKTPHKIEIQISSDTVTDFSGVTVRACGKNLCSGFVPYEGNRYVQKTENIPVVPNTDYTFSLPNDARMVKMYVVLGNSSKSYSADVSEGKITFNSGENVFCYLQVNNTTDYTSDITIPILNDSAMLNVGTTATEYEPYIEPVEFTANADGTVEGITSISPNMTVFTDNADVSITMSYRQSKIIEKTVSGSIISVDDVSEIPHEVTVKLSSDTVTDFSGVTVKTLGKNLYDSSVLEDYGFTYDGEKYTGETTKLADKIINANFAENTQYTISLVGYNTSSKDTSLVLYINYTDGTQHSVIAVVGTTETIYRATSTSGKTIKHLWFSYYRGGEINLSCIQIEKGATATEYEPYDETIYTTNADGTVESITSISPNMTVFTDNAGVDISMIYHQSYGTWLAWNRFWDGFQQNGARQDFRYAFAIGWTPATLNPKHIVRPGSNVNYAVGMFFMCNQNTGAGMLDFSLIADKFDFSLVTNAQALFRSANIDNIVADLSNATSLDSAFSADYEVMRLTTLTLKVSEKTLSFNSAFYGLRNLVNLTFMDGSIIGGPVNFQYSPLNKASIMSAMTALSDTATGKTVTFSRAAVNNAFETSSGAADGTSSEEWAALIATKSNWTISLV